MLPNISVPVTTDCKAISKNILGILTKQTIWTKSLPLKNEEIFEVDHLNEH